VPELNQPAVEVSPDGSAIAKSLVSPEAFTEIFDRHFGAVHRYIARRGGRDRADDLAARTFMVAFEHRGGYRDELGSARPWLLGIATNVLREEYRHEQRQLLTMAQLSNEAVVSADGWLGGEADEDHDLARALARLDSEQRDALVLHVWGELSYAEVALSLQIPIGTVRSRISRACASLRSDLQPAPPGGAGSTLDQEER
jgi:RNA polymerase sigma factor (sigma-70 family)